MDHDGRFTFYLRLGACMRHGIEKSTVQFTTLSIISEVRAKDTKVMLFSLASKARSVTFDWYTVILVQFWVIIIQI